MVVTKVRAALQKHMAARAAADDEVAAGELGAKKRYRLHVLR